MFDIKNKFTNLREVFTKKIPDYKPVIDSAAKLITNNKVVTNIGSNINTIVTYQKRIRRMILFVKFGIPLAGLFAVSVWTYSKLKTNPTIVIIKSKDEQ